ncbi:MAG: chorismate synthase [Clostridiales Family XIII bacterium]|jgi:chorismate synthase|nr:chorismate synthase [Clostridiales Family XIII bacterium]
MNSFGSLFRVELFGESHGPAVGVVVDGVPAGTALDFDRIAFEMRRRAPGRSDYTTPRREADETEILSGVKDGIATGAPIACVVRNIDTRSQDYPELLRPGHSDLSALLKYGEHTDRRGGGHFSGRVTAGLVFAGAIAKQILRARGTVIYGRIRSVAGDTDGIDLTRNGAVRGNGQGAALIETLRLISEKPFPAADEWEERFKKTIAAAKDARDSVGGVVEVICFGVPAGLGEPFFGSLESRAAQMIFSVPAVKGVEFGRGFEIAKLRGSEANDPLAAEDGATVSRTNNNGGILGGIANGMPVIVRAAVKPTSSIGVPQETVDPDTKAAATLELGGRHDPCIAPRAVPVIEGGLAIALLDLLFEGGLV